MDEKETALELKNVTKFIGKKKIIDHVSLDIKRGEIFGLLGPNGAGKTTIMRMITGLIKPTKGDILISGINLAEHHEDALAEIGAIIEAPDLYKHLSGKLNLKIMANMSRNVSTKEIQEATQFVGLSQRINDKVGKYSLGMRQRLGIASALVSRPKVLVLDEPLNGLDPDGVKEMRDTLLTLAQTEDVCIIISSHILSEMEQVCNRFAIIDKGIMIETMDMTETNSQNEPVPYRFVFLSEVESQEVEAVIQQIKLPEVFRFSSNELTVVGDREVIAKVIRALIEANIDIVSVTPHKKNLEEYFIRRVGEINQ